MTTNETNAADDGDEPSQSIHSQVPQTATVDPVRATAATLTFEGGGSIVIGSPSLAVHQQPRNYLLVGRQAATCDIRISHKSLSRQHAVLYYNPQPGDVASSPSSTTTTTTTTFLYIMDLDTKSGTFVNSIRIAPHEPTQLKSADTVQFGKAQPSFIVEWNNARELEAPVSAAKTADRRLGGEESEDVPALTGRAQRQAEIAAMMASLDQDPTYTKFEPTAETTTSSNTPAVQQEANSRESRIMEKYRLPLQESTAWATMEASTISAVAMDPSGARFALGSMDSALRLYDFGGLNADDPSPFQNVYVQEGYPTRSIAYAPSGDRFVVATGSSQPRMMDRDGSEELLEFARGDVYVIDPAKTTGHTAAVTCVQWHPLDKSIVYTTSRDGSLRRWTVDKGKLAFGMLKCEDVIVIKNIKTGRKTIPTCMAITPRVVALGTECGSLQIYAHPFQAKLRPQQSTIIRSDPEQEPSKILSIIYSIDGTKLACRSTTAVMVYNAERRLSTSSSPLLVCTNVGTTDETDNSTPTIAFSPDGKVICVGVTEQTIKAGVVHSGSRLDVYVIPKEGSSEDKKRRGPVFSHALGQDDPVMGLSWHYKLNQLLVARSKSFSLWYSLSHSQKGALLSVGGHRRTKRKLEEGLQDLYEARAPPPGSNVRYEEIIAPNALPMFGGDSKQKRKQKKLDQQEEDSKRKNPQQPAKSVYNTHNTIFAQLVVDNQTVDQKIIAGIDPREALAKYSEGKSFISTAYEGNTERILAERTVEEEEEEMKKR